MDISRTVSVDMPAYLGRMLAAVRQHTRERLRRPADLTRCSGVPLLAQLPRGVRPSFDDVFPGYTPAGRTFHLLREQVLAGLGPAVPGCSRSVLLVTGASRGDAASLVAANLACVLARADSEVVLVCAQLPDNPAEITPTPDLLGVRTVPGLSEILAGTISLDEGIQYTPRNPWLRVVTAGGTASAAGPARSRLVRETLEDLRGEAEHLIIEAPPTRTGAEAQRLASLADAAILAVELRRSTRTEVRDAAEQLLQAGTPLLGGVVLPRLDRPEAGRGTRTRASHPPESVPHQAMPGDRGVARLPGLHCGDETVVMARVDYDSLILDLDEDLDLHEEASS
jgi:Mrp family chromosome partitioning ATPase